MSYNEVGKKVKVCCSDGATSKSMMRWLQLYFPFMEESPFEEAQYLFYGDFGFKHARFRGVKIFVTGENHEANFKACDYALTHEREKNERRLYFPYCTHRLLVDQELHYGWKLSERPFWSLEDLEREKIKFCNFIYRNKVCKKRNAFFKKLNKQCPVESGGPLFNNIGYCVEDKLKFQKDFLFSIAYENESADGYQTEKLLEALNARTIPIYWGNRYVDEIFNPDCFINAMDFDSDEDLIDYVIRLAHDKERCLKYLNAPMFSSSTWVNDKKLETLNFFAAIFTSNQSVKRSSFDFFCFWLQQVFSRDVFYHLRRFFRFLKGKK